MWAGSAQLTGPSPGTLGWANLSPTYPFIFFLGRARPKWSSPGSHGCWPDPLTMQINKAACRTRLVIGCKFCQFNP